MPQTAIVNYHIHKPERQAFTLDAEGIAGNLVSPELVPTKVNLVDERTAMRRTSFADASVAFAALPTKVASFEGGTDWHDTYDRELTDLLRSEINAKEVVVFDHTVRVDDPDADRRPARNVHSDYSVDGAKQRLVDILGPSRAEDWSKGHYAFVNVWRPVGAPINSAPLGFVLPETVAQDDWILLDLVYPNRTGQIMGLAANPDHRWIYMSKMTPDDVAYFNIFDNRGRPSVAHSAMDLVEDPNIQTIRKSIESRTVIRY